MNMSGNKSENKDKKFTRKVKLYAIFIPFLFFLIYALSCLVLQLSFRGLHAVWGTAICDLIFAVLYSFLYHWVYIKKLHEKPSHYRFSGFGILCLLFMVMSVFLFSQLMGGWINDHFPSKNIHAYMDLDGLDLQLYVLSAITIAPIIEELIFRGFLYKFVRLMWGKPFSVIVSSLFFIVIHGTTEHIPVALLVTLFSCLLLEITGSIFYSIGFHMFYNLCGCVYVTAVPITGWAIVIGFVIVSLFLCLGLVYSDKLKIKLAPDGMTSVIELLDLQRGHIKYIDEIDTKNDDKKDKDDL